MRAKIFFLLCAVAAGSWICAARASQQAGAATVYAVKGSAEYSSGGSDSKPLTPGQVLPPGTTVKTSANSSVDLVLQSSGSAVHLNPASELDINKLTSTPCGDQTVTETGLELKSGSMVGCTGKLPPLSEFNVKTPTCTSHFNGTQYLVSANGDVTVISGKVSVDFDPNGKKNDKEKGENNVTVTAGETFDPATGKVVPTSPQFLKDIIADVKTVKDIAETFNTDCASITVFSEQPASPIHGHHDHDHDHDHDKDDHGHDDHGHDDGHGSPGDGYAGGDSGHGK